MDIKARRPGESRGGLRRMARDLNNKSLEYSL